MSPTRGFVGTGFIRWILLPLISGMILAGGCVFTPREAETPDVDDTEWIQPTEPIHVLTNMKYALAALTTTNYENSLDDDFIFTPSGGDFADYFANWDSEKEMRAIDKLYTQVTAIDLEWDDDPTIVSDDSGGRVIEMQDFKMIVTYNNIEEPVVFHGRTDFHMKQTGTLWKLQEWDESVSASDQTGSHLRQNLEITD